MTSHLEQGPQIFTPRVLDLPTDSGELTPPTADSELGGSPANSPTQEMEVFRWTSKEPVPGTSQKTLVHNVFRGPRAEFNQIMRAAIITNPSEQK